MKNFFGFIFFAFLSISSLAMDLAISDSAAASDIAPEDLPKVIQQILCEEPENKKGVSFAPSVKDMSDENEEEGCLCACCCSEKESTLKTMLCSGGIGIGIPSLIIGLPIVSLLSNNTGALIFGISISVMGGTAILIALLAENIAYSCWCEESHSAAARQASQISSTNSASSTTTSFR